MQPRAPSAAALLPLLLLVLLAPAARAYASERPLRCVHPIVKDVQDYCSDRGTVLAGARRGPAVGILARLRVWQALAGTGPRPRPAPFQAAT